MSGKHGSARDGRDPNTPDTLLERLAHERERREEARAQAMSEQTRAAISTPAPAAVKTEPAAQATPDSRSSKTARSHLTFDNKSQERERQQPPPSERKTWEGMLEMGHADLIEYMGKLGANEELLAFMLQLELDGSMWRTTISHGDPPTLKPDIETIIKEWSGGSSPPAAVIKITSHSKLAFEQWSQDQSTSIDNHDKPFSLKDLHSIKIPELPGGKGADGRLTREQLKGHVDALHSTFNFIDREFSNRIIGVSTSPTLETLAICLEGMTTRSWQLNELVASSIMKKSEDKSIATIIAMKQHIEDGRYSGLNFLQALGAATTQLTGARLGDLLLKLFKPLTDMPNDINKLEPMYKTHQEALTSLLSLDIKLHPVIQCFILQQMASKLAQKPEHNLVLGIPMASIIKKGFEDLIGMTAMLEAAIIEASNDPKNNKPRVKSDRERALEKQIAVLTGSKNKETDKVCVHHREEEVTGFKCVDKNCKYKHERSGKTCSTPEYDRYGRCLNFFGSCPHLHPFHDRAKAEFGAPQIAWQALTATIPKAPKRYSKKGKSYAVMLFGGAQEAEIDELNESGPIHIDLNSDDDQDTPIINLISDSDDGSTTESVESVCNSGQVHLEASMAGFTFP